MLVKIAIFGALICIILGIATKADLGTYSAMELIAMDQIGKYPKIVYIFGVALIVESALIVIAAFWALFLR